MQPGLGLAAEQPALRADSAVTSYFELAGLHVDAPVMVVFAGHAWVTGHPAHAHHHIMWLEPRLTLLGSIANRCLDFSKISVAA